MDKLYLISPLANKEEVHEYCFKTCQKIIIGGIDFMEAPWLPCREEKCLYEEKCLDMGKREVMGKKKHIIVRKLKTIRVKE